MYFTQGERGDISTAASVAHSGIENNFKEHLTNDELEEIEDPEALERTAQLYEPGMRVLHKTLEPAFQEIPFLEDWKQGILGGFDRAENFVQGHPFLAAGISSPLKFLVNPATMKPIALSCDLFSAGRGTVDLFFPTTPFGLALSVPIGKGALLAKEGSFALRGIGKLDTRLNAKVFELVAPAPKSNLVLLEAPNMVRHHVFNKFRGESIKSQKYRDFFTKHNIDVDSFTIEIPSSFHRSQIHTANNNWTTKWKEWIDANPKASTKEVYQFAGRLMDDYNVNYFPLIHYKAKK